MYTWYKGVQLKSNLNTLEPEGLLHVCPAACVIAQQYSSATVVSLRFHFPQGKIQCAFQKCFLLIFVGVFRSRKTELA
jgi:hypothetical protein